MGGGSSFSWDNVSPKEIKREILNQDDRKNYEQEVSVYLKNTLKDINDRDNDAVNKHIDEITKALESDIDGTINIYFGGSVSKHTYVDGLSDIDSLVNLKNSELQKMSPTEVKQYFYDKLKARFPSTEIIKGDLCVTLKFSDIDIQLLPAIKTKVGYKIFDSKGENWSKINPTIFTKKLSEMNAKFASKLVPTIKLAKAAISELPSKKQLSGYHTEALAIEVFKNYTGRKIPSEMLKFFFREARNAVLSPIRDKSGQSIYVDQYLKGKGSLERNLVSDSLGRISRRLEKADLGQNINIWKDIV